MNQMKEFYIAPEVEILCFAPVENLASSLWDAYSLSGDGDMGKPVLPGSPGQEGWEDNATTDPTNPNPNPDGDE